MFAAGGLLGNCLATVASSENSKDTTNQVEALVR